LHKKSYLFCPGYGGQWHWLGNTLNPYYEGNTLDATITDDRFLYDTLVDWYFGQDNTGDVMLAHNLAGLKKKVAERGQKFHLVSGSETEKAMGELYITLHFWHNLSMYIFLCLIVS
jgi:hypothetical protein